jgi:hypothetical protein
MGFSFSFPVALTDIMMSREVVQSVGITFNKVKVTSSNISSPFYVDMSKKKKKNLTS